VRAVLGFDPRGCEYGPATSSIRTILLEWADIDWFEPAAGGEAEALRLFREHNAIAHAHDPDRFAERIELGCEAGDWERFAALCAAVRNSGWDWRLSILKQLSSDHAEARGWRLDDQVAGPEDAPRPGELFYRIRYPSGQAGAMWRPIGDGHPELEALPGELGESARFYYGYAHADGLDSIKWQLAEGHDDLAGNPFYRLVRCYRAGFYPFSLGRSTVTLFRFTAAPAPRALPRATLLRRRGRGRRPG
jgi:hypothetical protein